MSTFIKFAWDEDFDKSQRKIGGKAIEPFMAIANYKGGCGLENCQCSPDYWISGRAMIDGESRFFQINMDKKTFQSLIDDAKMEDIE